MKYPYQGEPSWCHTNIGLHLKPASFHSDWLGDTERREYELGILRRIKASWVTMLTDGDSAIEVISGKEAVRWLLDEEIIPIIRDSTDKLPRAYTNIAFVGKLVQIYSDYKLRPLVIIGNEPGDAREWVDENVPQNWKDVFLGVWVSAARQVMSAGANAGFPDPLGDWQYFFDRMPNDIIDAFAEGRCVFTAHLYGKARPLDYPEDDVSLNGTPATYEEYRAAMDDFADIWGVPNIDDVNRQRAEWADPNKTFLDDSTCFGAWRNINYYAEKSWGFKPVMCMTEGGWTPKDQAGSVPVDIRYPPSTIKKIADKTLNALSEDTGMFALTFWLSYGWSDDGWYYSPLQNVIDQDTGEAYGPEQKVIKALESSNSVDTLLDTIREEINKLNEMIK